LIALCRYFLKNFQVPSLTLDPDEAMRSMHAMS